MIAFASSLARGTKRCRSEPSLPDLTRRSEPSSPGCAFEPSLARPNQRDRSESSSSKLLRRKRAWLVGIIAAEEGLARRT
eukprot:6188372-Pleurochrysis_carterae.AAC.5